jgi:uncharacterized protein RhaS with RHS repeats
MTTKSAIILTCGLFWLGTGPNAWSFYNPNTGRWLTRDPIGEGGGPHLHQFVNNAPVRNFDIAGLYSRSEASGY